MPDADAPNTTSDLPAPTVTATCPVAVPAVSPHPQPPRAGELSIGWRAAMAATWIGVFLSLAAVWNASVQLGLSTWWLGARSLPQPRFVQFSPFVAPVLMVLASINQVRRLSLWGVLAAAVVAAVGIFDLNRVAGLAAVEIAVAIAAGAVSLASTTGTYRHRRPVPASDAST